MADEIEKRNEAFLIYQDENGVARVNVRFEGEDVWLTVEQIMELFDASQQDVSYHIKQIYADGEQDAERTHKKYLLVRQEGSRSVRRNMSHYNLDMIRKNPDVATSEIAEKIGISRRSIAKMTNKLQTECVILCVGARKCHNRHRMVC